MVKYINIWIGCDNDGILSWLSRHLTYDPLIWSKLTSLTSTVSVLKDGKKIHLKFYYSFQEMNFKKISSLNNLTGLNDLDSIISSNKLLSLTLPSTLVPELPILVSQCWLDFQTSTFISIFGNLSV